MYDFSPIEEKQWQQITYHHVEGHIHRITLFAAGRETVETSFQILDEIFTIYRDQGVPNGLPLGLLVDHSEARPQPVVHLLNELRKFSSIWRANVPDNIHQSATVRTAVLYNSTMDETIGNLFARLISSPRFNQLQMQYFPLEEEAKAMQWLRYEMDM